MVRAYAKRFLPLTDVYEYGGPETFNELDGGDDHRNAVVVPLSFLRDLNDPESGVSSFGGRKTLERLASLTRRQDGSKKVEDGVITHSVSSGLDIILVGDNGQRSGSFLGEVERVTTVLTRSGEEKPVILTADPYRTVSLSATHRVEKPKFLLVGPGILEEGILAGSGDLSTAVFQGDGEIPLEEAMDILDRELYPNQFIRLGKGSYAKVTGTLRRNPHRTRILIMEDLVLQEVTRNRRPPINLFGIEPLDTTQYLALEHALLNPDVGIAFISGAAGSGKTILSYAAALDQVLTLPERSRRRMGIPEGCDNRYDRIVVLKPNDLVGGRQRDLGFLPGGLYQKIKVYLESYADAHKLTRLYQEGISFEDMFLHPRFKGDFGKTRNHIKGKTVNGRGLPDREVIELAYSGFLRGRSFQRTLMIIDEAQNFTPYEMRTILTRLGEGSKVLVLGDARDQVDSTRCTSDINGLTHAVREYLGRPYSCVVPLSRVHRSQMAEDAVTWPTYV